MLPYLRLNNYTFFVGYTDISSGYVEIDWARAFDIDPGISIFKAIFEFLIFIFHKEVKEQYGFNRFKTYHSLPKGKITYMSEIYSFFAYILFYNNLKYS